MPPFPSIKAPHSSFLDVTTVSPHCTRNQVALVLLSSPGGHLTCLFERHLPYSPALTAPQETTTLTRVPVADLRRPAQCGGDQEGEDGPFSPGPGRNFMCDQVPLLHSQDEMNPGIVLGNQPGLLATSLSLSSVSSTMLVAVCALSQPHK